MKNFCYRCGKPLNGYKKYVRNLNLSLKQQEFDENLIVICKDCDNAQTINACFGGK